MRKTTVSIATIMSAMLTLANCSSTDTSSETRESEPVVVTGVVSPDEPAAEAEPMPARVSEDAFESAPSTVAAMEGSSAMARDEAGLEPPHPIPDVIDDAPRPQSGLLTAGDYDDLLNAQLYRDYASEFLQEQRGNLDLPDIDVTDAITIKVTDRDGAPLRGATVALTAGGQAMFTLKTSSAGTVRLFPEFDALPQDLKVSITGRGAMVRQMTYDEIMSKAESGPITVKLGEPNHAASEFDLMLVIDTTGSMGDELRFLQAELTDIVESIEETHPGINTRIGLTLYRDIGDQYVVRKFDFTSNIDELQANLAAQEARGGGNYPEAMDQALEAAMGQSWRDDSVKAVMLVADAPPRDENIGKAWDQAILARPKGIHIVPVAASGVGPKAEYIMRAMAAVTQSRYIFLTDDSGIGNPHAEPDVDCYVVTRLDTMVKRVLSSLITGERSEPTEAEIIRSVGNYNAGVCELPEPEQEQVQQVRGGN